MATTGEVVADDLYVREGPGKEYPAVGSLPHGAKVEFFDDWVAIMFEGHPRFVSRKFLFVTEEAELPPPGEPPWFTWAKKQLGKKETPGGGDNPDIVDWFKFTTLPKSMYHDATAWCAVFVNAAFFLNGIKGLRSARAVDWMEFGTDAGDDPQPGDVTVFEWDSGQHHVAFFEEWTDDTHVRVIGGNQSDAVTETVYPGSMILGFRRPPKA